MNAADTPPTELQPIEIRPADTSRKLLCRVLRRAFFAFLLAATLALVAAHWLPLKYRGTTTFMLRTDSAAGTDRSRGNESLEQAKLTLQHDLLDRNALETVIAELGLDQGLARNKSNDELTREGQQAKQKLVESLGKSAALNWEVKSSNVDLLSLSFTHADPKIAAAFPNALVKNYIERTSAKISSRLTGSSDFLKTQVRNCETRLTYLDADRVKFETEHVAAMPESPGVVQSRIDGLKAEMTRLARERIKAQYRIDGIKRKIAQLNEVFPHAIAQLKKNWPQAVRDEVDKILSPWLPDKGTAPSASQPARRTSQDSPGKPTYDPLGLYAMSEAMAEYRMAMKEWEILQGESVDIEKKYNNSVALMSNFHVVRKRYEEIRKRFSEQQLELNKWHARLSEIQMALSGEAANRRTHMTCIEVAQVKFLPESPQLMRILAGVICVVLLAIHWAISPLVTLGQKAIAVVWVSLVSLALLLFMQHPLAVLGLSACVVISAWLAVVLDRCWLRSRAGALVVLVFAIAIVCAGAMAMNSITLKLQFPDMFAEWKDAPLTFIYERWLTPVGEWVSHLLS